MPTIENFQLLIAHLQDVVYSVDVETKRFSYISPAFERLFGYTAGDIQQMGDRPEFLKTVIQGGKFIEQDRILEELKTGKRVERFRHVAWWRCKDDTLKCIEDHWVAVFENGRLVATDGVLRDITEQKRLEDEQARLIGELQAALAKIKTLRGLIPICAACKKIRDDDGYWQKVEEYIGAHTDASFTHGLCPDCRSKYFPDESLAAP
ncbi:MAG: PAS domain S-box protein [Kiritimatiellaeota bacterium]|nr:PAS domain S-box protein [Kiritimatiellota bacterium]